VTDLQKVHLLYQHLDGRANKVVEQLQYTIEDPATAYNEARKTLKERFGHTAFLETDFATMMHRDYRNLVTSCSKSRC
jgi:uncharacterized membrane-anchored protein YhcB (DUF1043 family)